MSLFPNPTGLPPLNSLEGLSLGEFEVVSFIIFKLTPPPLLSPLEGEGEGVGGYIHVHCFGFKKRAESHH
jgi:hypothetical protein